MNYDSNNYGTSDRYTEDEEPFVDEEENYTPFLPCMNYKSDNYGTSNRYSKDEELFIDEEENYTPFLPCMNYESNNYSTSDRYSEDNELFIDENYIPFTLCMSCPLCQYHLYSRQELNLLATVPEIKNLKGKKIKTTVPNITGTITATVGNYNSSTNRVELKNIISERDGVNYGTLSYLPEELGGLTVLGNTSPGTPGGTSPSTPGGTSPSTQNCTITGGKGKLIASGSPHINISGISASLSYTIYECQIEVTPKISGIATERYIINRKNNRISVKWPTSPITRVLFTAWVQNKELWVEIELQHRILTGQWRRTTGTKTKLGSWASLKF